MDHLNNDLLASMMKQLLNGDDELAVALRQRLSCSLTAPPQLDTGEHSLVNSESNFPALNTNNPPLSKKPRVDDSGFSYPPVRHTAKRQFNLVNTGNPSTQNPFAALGEDPDNPSAMCTEDESTDETTTADDCTTAAANKSASLVKKVKIKPISIVRTENFEDTLNYIHDNLTENFHVTSSADYVRIFPDTPDDHRVISKYVEDTEEVDGFILPIGPPKFFKVVFRKLPITTPVEKIKADLLKKGYPVVSVTQIVSARTGKINPIFTIELQADAPDAPNIWEVGKVLYHRVIVEKYIPPNKVRQCHKCQKFHHSSANCFMKPRCVKCAGPHLTMDCPHGKGKISEDLVLCCNCDKKHPASWQGCEKYPKRTFRSSAAQRTEGRSYAQASKREQGDQLPSNETAPSAQAESHVSALAPSTGNQPNLALIAQVREIIDLSNTIAELLGTADLTKYVSQLRATARGLQAAKDTDHKAISFFEGLLLSPVDNGSE